MIAPRIASLLAVLTFAAPIALHAQQEPPVAPGDRVRVTAPSIDPDRFIGVVVVAGADTCVLEVEGRAEPLTLPLASVTRLEVSRGQKSNAGKGALTGGLAGAALGLVLGGAALVEGGSDADVLFVGLAAGLSVVGAGVGLSIGAMSTSDRWEEVPLDRLRVSVVPQPRGGLVVSASIRL